MSLTILSEKGIKIVFSRIYQKKFSLVLTCIPIMHMPMGETDATCPNDLKGTELIS